MAEPPPSYTRHIETLGRGCQNLLLSASPLGSPLAREIAAPYFRSGYLTSWIVSSLTKVLAERWAVAKLQEAESESLFSKPIFIQWWY